MFGDSSTLFQVGFARADITPPVGFPLSGYAVREGRSKALDAALSLSALVLREGTETAIILAADFCVIDVAFVTELRHRCALVAGIEPACVLLNVSHSHSAPGIGKYVEFGLPEEMEERTFYWETVLAAAEVATSEALAALKPARFSVR